jgi:hypothetical protein
MLPRYYLLLLCAVSAFAQNQVAPGRFVVDPPTLENLGFRWYIDGDDNRNATVEVSYRKQGRREWKQALPLLRVHRENVNQDYGAHRAGNLFAGSVLFLQPATTYEVRFAMRDPDGGAPEPSVVTATTRGEPKAFSGGRKIHVYPKTGLLAAYETARPGDILLLHAGVYKPGVTLVLTRSGEPLKPIVIRGGVDGEAIFEGEGHQVDLLNVQRADHLMFEDLTLRHARHAILAGVKGEPGARGLSVRRCRISDVIWGITTASENSRNWYIADNVLTGVNPTWYPRPDVEYMSPSHTGINYYGQGNVICYNRVSHFSDAAAPANNGPPLEDLDKQPVSNDVYGNEFFFAQDDNLETDYGAHNFRVYRNRMYNGHTGISVQPFYGGPVYMIRNEIYGVTALTFKLHNYCAGILAYHNTNSSAASGFQSFDRWQNGQFRNNLFLAGQSRNYAMMTGSLTSYSSMDYDGYRRNDPARLIRWFDGRQRANYNSLEEFAKGTGHETHGIMVDYDIFVKAAPPALGVSSDPAQYDLRLRPGSVAVDAGVRLPNVNDGFSGKAPDLGCYELGAPLPHYGPRARRNSR